MTAKYNKNAADDWKIVEVQKTSGVVINIDVHGNLFFQARFRIHETRTVDTVQHLRIRDVLGEPVYTGEFGDKELYIKHPEFILAAQVIKAMWPTIQAVTDEYSDVKE